VADDLVIRRMVSAKLKGTIHRAAVDGVVNRSAAGCVVEPDMRITDDKLHEAIYRLAQRQRAGDHSCDVLLGKLLDVVDERARGYDEELEHEDEQVNDH
jgi:hypothetical protein